MEANISAVSITMVEQSFKGDCSPLTFNFGGVEVGVEIERLRADSKMMFIWKVV